MDKIDTLMKEIEQRITQLESDKLIDSSKKAILIHENKRFLVRCQKLFLSAVINRRELLVAFLREYHTSMLVFAEMPDVETIVDDYLKSN